MALSLDVDPDAVRDALRERGYVVLRNVIDPAAIARARAHLEMAVDTHLEQAVASGAVPNACAGLPLETRLARAYDLAGPDAAPVSWVAQTKSSFVFQQLLFRDASLCRLIEQITGRPPCLAPRFNVRSKVPGSAAVSFPWHQDHAFFRMQYLLKKQPVRRLLAVWAPLLPTDASNGVLSLEANSHKHGFVPHRRVGGFLAVPPEAEPAGEGEASRLCPGDVVLFTDLTLHRSGPNCSTGVRWTADWAVELLDADDICPPLRRPGGGAEPGHAEGSVNAREELPGQTGPPSAGRLSGVAVAPVGVARVNAEETSPFECPVCLRLMHLPTTLHCGHSLCRGCLVACMQHAARCPECRVDLPPQMSSPATSLALHKALRKLYPSEYAAREAEDAAAPTPAAGPSTGHASLPLFVLEPLLPRQRMQLHVYEPRYTALTRRVMAGDRTFGMVALEQNTPVHGLATGNFSRAAPVGVLIRVLDCRPLPQGRFLVSIEGVRRFRTLRTWDVDGYSVAQVAWLADEPVTASERRLETTLLGAELSAMLDEWVDKVTRGKWERSRSQMERIQAQLGPRPGPALPEELGLWAAALLNPLPPLGVAPELRLQALSQRDSLARLSELMAAVEMSLRDLRAPRHPVVALLGGVLDAAAAAAAYGWAGPQALVVFAVGLAAVYYVVLVALFGF